MWNATEMKSQKEIYELNVRENNRSKKDDFISEVVLISDSDKDEKDDIEEGALSSSPNQQINTKL